MLFHVVLRTTWRMVLSSLASLTKLKCDGRAENISQNFFCGEDSKLPGVLQTQAGMS